MTAEKILSELKAGSYHPVYFLMGEESYYIDLITNYISEHVLDEGEKSFNQTVLYGKDTDTAGIINTAKRYPMMAERQVVIVKEAQNLKDIDDLVYYVKQPLKSTLLVINYKYKKLDKRKVLYNELKEHAVVFESNRLYDDKIPGWISAYLSTRNINIESKASRLLTEFLGNDLSKIVNELEKLIITMEGPGNTITSALIERNIGISKDYNNFELQKALIQKDALKAFRIVDYFDKNQKNNPYVVTIAILFAFFSKVLNLHFLKDRSKGNVALALRVSPYFVSDYQAAARRYDPRKTVEVIALLREYDLKSKGVGNVSTPPGDLLRELIYKILK